LLYVNPFIEFPLTGIFFKRAKMGDAGHKGAGYRLGVDVGVSFESFGTMRIGH
jgi:hypothetical protein